MIIYVATTGYCPTRGACYKTTTFSMNIIVVLHSQLPCCVRLLQSAVYIVASLLLLAQALTEFHEQAAYSEAGIVKHFFLLWVFHV